MLVGLIKFLIFITFEVGLYRYKPHWFIFVWFSPMLPASLKDDTARMNDRNKHKVTGQMKHQRADPKANASVFLFFPTAHFLKTILASRTNSTFGFFPTQEPKLKKPKELFFANA